MSAHDAIVIGGGTAGLVAAAYLARAGKRTVLIEESDMLGGLCGTAPLAGAEAPGAAHLLYALNPRVVAELKLARLGLRFAARDLPLVALRHDGKHLMLNRSVQDGARSIALQSRADADAWPRFRSELFLLARSLRPLWWNGVPARLDREQQALLDRLSRTSAAAWLDSWFESDVLKTALAFDAAAPGLSPGDPGSALVLLWRAAQEMCGLQGAVAFPTGGPAALTSTLALAARQTGADLRTRARATSLIVERGAIAGVDLDNETLTAPLVFSSLPAAATYGLASFGAEGLAQASAREHVRTGEARITFVLSELPALAGVAVPLQSRFIFAERETLASASLASALGQLVHEPAFEMILPAAIDPALSAAGRPIVSVLVRPVPLAPEGGWAKRKAELAARVVAVLERHWPGLDRRILAIDILTPDELPPPRPTSVPRILSAARERSRTPIAGLFLCGADAEPVGAISGQAARLAVAAMRERAR